jgi:hypothetical protein
MKKLISMQTVMYFKTPYGTKERKASTLIADCLAYLVLYPLSTNYSNYSINYALRAQVRRKKIFQENFGSHRRSNPPQKEKSTMAALFFCIFLLLLNLRHTNQQTPLLLPSFFDATDSSSSPRLQATSTYLQPTHHGISCGFSKSSEKFRVADCARDTVYHARPTNSNIHRPYGTYCTSVSPGTGGCQ